MRHRPGPPIIVLTTILVFTGTLPIRGGNPRGFIQQDQWACLVPLQGLDCRGGEPHSMKENWVWPHVVADENPMEGTRWAELEPGSWREDGAPGTWKGGGDAVFVVIGPGSDPDVVDWNEYLSASGLPDNFVLGLAVTYVENTLSYPLRVGVCTSSDDSIQVWVNNTVVQNVSTCRPLAESCSEISAAVLAPGVNRITALVWEGYGGFSFQLALTKPDGERYTSLDSEVLSLGPNVKVPPPVLPVLRRSHEGSETFRPSKRHDVTLSGSLFDDGALYRVEEELRGPVTPGDITIPEGCPQGNITAIDAETEPVGMFFRTVVGSPCSIDNTTSYQDGMYTTRARTGGDIWAQGDTFEFAFQYVEGNFDIAVELVEKALPTRGRWGKFGLMVRQDLQFNSRFTAILDVGPHPPDDPDPARCILRRTHLITNDVGEILVPTPELVHPTFLRLTRRGNLVETWVSNTLGEDANPADDRLWVRVCADEWLDSVSFVYIGFAYSVHHSGGCYTGEIAWKLREFEANLAALNGPPGGARIQWDEVPGSVLNSSGVTYTVGTWRGSIVETWGRAEGSRASGPNLLTFQDARTGPIGIFDDSHDIGHGGPCATGSLTHDARGADGLEDDVYVMRADGTDIGTGGDQFHFAYKLVSGDFAVEARLPRVVHPESGEPWGKFGLMARWDCRPNAAYFFVHNAVAAYWQCHIHGPRTAFRPHGGHDNGIVEPNAIWWQDVHGEQPLHPDCLPVDVDPRLNDLRGDERNIARWLRMVRRGSAFYGYGSDDGVSWTSLGACAWPDAPDTMLVGVAATSHADCTTMDVTFDSFRITDPSPIEPVLDGDVIPPGAIVASDDFDDDGEGVCPGGWICSRRGSGGFEPGVAGGRLRLGSLRTRGAANGADVAATAFLDRTFDPRRPFLFDFDLHFSYDQEATGDGYPPADGLTFAVVGTGTGTERLDLRVGDPGSGLGYDRMNLSLDESVVRSRDLSLNSFAVEFDNWHSEDVLNEGEGSVATAWNPIGGAEGTGKGTYHVALDVSSSIYSVQRNLQVKVSDEALPDIYDPSGIHAQVLYDNGRVKAWVGSNREGGGVMTLVLDAEIEPVALNAPSVLIGFTAATGDATCVMEVDNFEMRDLLLSENPSFHRGDADANESLQLTDAIRILNFLFLGGNSISCEDAADTDDNGTLQLTDAIRILGFLFLGGPAPAPPFNACGIDPTPEDDLDCISFPPCS